ncbi:MAG TPA: nucleoside hydrolase [Bacillales bacterium]|nr:nucleoside hydrolase [Bacillales bacterium]
MRQRKMIIDCDPGYDDAVAILLAALHPEISIQAITTVAGNVEVDKTSRNALQLCELAGMPDVPVARGAVKPLMKPLTTAYEFHGETGLGGANLRQPEKQLEPDHAVDVLINKILSEDEITVVAVGPLTNIALALSKQPEIKERIDELIIMGGGSAGNITPAAEFNIFVDAEAAKTVFESGVPITLLSLDVTQEVLATPKIVDEIQGIHSPISEFITDLFQYFYQNHGRGPAMHDVCAVAYCIDPSIFQTVACHVDIETKGEFTYGMTVIDRSDRASKGKNVQFAIDVDQERFWKLLINSLQNAASTVS